MQFFQGGLTSFDSKMANRDEKKKNPATGTGLSSTKPKIAVVSTPDAVAKFN